jgi:hypothetical protein
MTQEAAMPDHDLVAIWDAHCRYEFETRDVDATMGARRRARDRSKAASSSLHTYCCDGPPARLIVYMARVIVA